MMRKFVLITFINLDTVTATRDATITLQTLT